MPRFRQIDTLCKTLYCVSGWYYLATQTSVAERNSMKINGLSIVPVLAWSAFAAAAMQEGKAEAMVTQMLGDGSSATEIIETLVEDDRTLTQAAVVAVSASSGDKQIDLAKAAICASIDATEAEEVGQAAVGVVGAGPTADVIYGAVEDYETGMCARYAKKLHPPAIYQTEGTGAPGGTHLNGPGRPPVSPAS